MPKKLSETLVPLLERETKFQAETRTQLAEQTPLQGLENKEDVSGHTLVMSFCPKCGALLELVHGKSAIIYCRKCKYRAKIEKTRVWEKKIKASDRVRREIAVLDHDSNLRTFPVVHAICSECNNDTSETWMMAIGSEGTTGVTFLRCTCCGHTRREAE